jgi:FkbM family methyltransferase
MTIYDVQIERVTTRYGRLYVAAKDSVIGRSLKIYGEWAEDEIGSYAALLSDGDTILDVGANIGTHAIALASRFPRSEVVAFEPQPLAFSLLVANVIAARTGNVYPRNLGCAEADGLAHVAPDYEASGWNVGGFSIAAGEAEQPGALPMPLVALDGLNFKRRVQFIKIDVEGMEPAVLAGAAKLIARDRPIIYFEVLDVERLGDSRPLLASLGYELRWLQSEAFNPRNFRLNPENVWRRGETGVLAMPAVNDPRVAHMPLVSGTEREVPVIEYPDA